MYNAPPTVFDSSRHRLHGVVHANGFGHLLRVNGREGGSRSHTGWQLTALWDALCSGLRVRVVTVEDVSMRGGMELRVLHTVAHGHTWYGQFGYEFGRGPYNTTETQWAAAGQYLTMASLNHLLQDFEAVEDRVRAIVERYRLPVGRAVKVKDLGTLLYRLLYLQSTPEDALLFFDPTALAKARRVLQAEEAAETAKRLGQKKVGPKAASTGTKKPQPSNGRGGAGAKGGASSAPPLPTIKLRLTGSSAERSKNDPVQSKKRPAESAHSGQEAKRSKSATIAGGSGASAVGLAAQQIQLVVGRRVKVYMKDKRTWYHGAVEKWDSAER